MVIRADPGENIFLVGKVYTFIDALSRIGSLFTSFTMIGKAFVLVYSYRLLASSLVGKLYNFRPKYKSEVANKQLVKKRDIVTLAKRSKSIVDNLYLEEENN